MQFKTINNVQVVNHTPIAVNKKPWRGHKLFPEQFFNCFICARKKSGKTNLLFNILKKTTGKQTRIIIFSSTYHKDPMYLEIVKYFESKGTPIVCFETIKNGNFEEMMEILNKNEYDDEEECEDDEREREKCRKLIKLSDDESDDDSKKRKKKKKIPDYTIVFDDLSSETRSKDIPILLKKNRHYRSRILISSQYPLDLDPQSLKQMDYIILFPHHSDDKLKTIFKHADLSITEEEFLEAYKEATKEQYNFLYIDLPGNKLRKNFNQLIEI